MIIRCSVCISYFFTHEHFPGHVGVGEVDTSREAMQLGANAVVIRHHGFDCQDREAHEWVICSAALISEHNTQRHPQREGAGMVGGSGMSCAMGAGCRGGGGESGGAGGRFLMRWEPKRSSRERCFCLMLLEMTRGPLVDGGEDGGLDRGDS